MAGDFAIGIVSQSKTIERETRTAHLQRPCGPRQSGRQGSTTGLADSGFLFGAASRLVERVADLDDTFGDFRLRHIEVLREIKATAELRRIPVVVLTTSKADTDIEGVYELGANSFISKPVQVEGLVNLMKLLGQYWFGTVELPLAK